MKKNYLLSLFLPLFTAGCVSQLHRPENLPTKLKNGNVQIQIMFHDDDVTMQNTSVNAYNEQCEAVHKKDLGTFKCTKKLIGQGRVLMVGPDKTSTVEFASEVPINSNTKFEVTNKN